MKYQNQSFEQNCMAVSFSNLLRALLHYEYNNSLNIIIFVRCFWSTEHNFTYAPGNIFYGAPCWTALYIYAYSERRDTRLPITVVVKLKATRDHRLAFTTLHIFIFSLKLLTFPTFSFSETAPLPNCFILQKIII